VLPLVSQARRNFFDAQLGPQQELFGPLNLPCFGQEKWTTQKRVR
jgi:hypothetical protein